MLTWVAGLPEGTESLHSETWMPVQVQMSSLSSKL